MGSREQALIREFPNGETHLRQLEIRCGSAMGHMGFLVVIMKVSATEYIGG